MRSYVRQSVYALVCVSYFTLISFGQVSWVYDTNEAQRVATQTGKPILLHFYSDNCVPCKALETRAFRDPHLVRSFQQNLVTVKINTDQRRDLAAKYNVVRVPTDVFLAANGEEIHRTTSIQDPSEYSRLVDHIALRNRDRLIERTTRLAAKAPATSTNAFATSNAASTASNRYHTDPPSAFQTRAVNDATIPPTSLSALSKSSPVIPPAPSQPPAVASGSPAFINNPFANSQTPVVAPGQQQSVTSAGPAHLLPNQIPQTVSPHTNNVAASTMPAMVPATMPTMTPAMAPAMMPAAQHVVSNPPTAQVQPVVATARTMQGQGSAFQLPTAKAAEPPTFPQSNFMVPPSPTNQAALNHRAATPAPTTTPTLAPVNGQQTVAATAATIAAPPNGSQNAAASAPAVATAIGLEGFCPVTLAKKSAWTIGSNQFAVRHRGKVYFCVDEAARQEFLRDPDHFSPVLSGFDPVYFLDAGKPIEGKREFGCWCNLENEKPLLLFADMESRTKYDQNPEYYMERLQKLLHAADGKVADRSPATNHFIR